MRIHLKASNGNYITADGGGGGPLTARGGAAPSPAATFFLRDLTGAGLQDGDRVRLVVLHGQYVSAQGGGGGDVLANRMEAADWEQFTLAVIGGGPAQHGSNVAVRAHRGQYLRRDANDRLRATAVAAGDAESMTLELPDRLSSDPAVGGQFRLSPKHLSLCGVHAALLRTGLVIFFAYYDHHEENNINHGKWQLWDPRRDSPIGTHAHGFNRNWFCSGHCILPDGRLLVVAGQSNNFPLPGAPSTPGPGADHDVHVLDPGPPERWTRLNDMPVARYYPTCATLANGDGFIASGARQRGLGSNAPNDTFEIFLAASNELTPPRQFRPSGTDFLEGAEYPFLQLLPDGSNTGILFVHSGAEARLFGLDDLRFRPWSFKTTSHGSRTYPHQGACVLLPLLPSTPDPIRILVVGGREGSNDPRATRTAEIFEFNRAVPSNSRWRAPNGGSANFRRFMSDAVLLPDETVLVVNGASRGAADSSHDPVMEGEIFDSRTERWHVVGTINRPRMYHSIAILLPDGRVAITGNTYTFNPDNEIEDHTVDIYSPPYLFRGARPVLSSAPEQLDYGIEMLVETPNPQMIESVALIRSSSTTHTNNMDQRYVGLTIRTRTATGLVVVGPPDSTVAPPGPYLLFLLSTDRIPSEGRFIQVGRALAVPTFPDWELLDENPASVAIVAADDELYQLHNDGRIWRYIGPPVTGWELLDENPATKQIAAAAGRLYQLHNTGHIWRYVGPPVTGWELLDENAASVAIVAADGELYQLHNDGRIWRYVGPPVTGWELLDENPATKQIAAAAGRLYQLHNTGHIWRYTGPPVTGWELVDENAASVTIVAADVELYQLHNDGRIWRYVGPPVTGWELLDENPATKQIAAAGGSVYQLHNNGAIWKYTGPPVTGWQQLDNNPASVAIAAGGNNLYQLHNTGHIWKYTG